MNTKKVVAEMKALPKTLDMAIFKARMGAHNFFSEVQYRIIGLVDKDMEHMSRQVGKIFQPLIEQYVSESSLLPRPIKNTRAFYRYIKACMELGNEMGNR